MTTEQLKSEIEIIIDKWANESVVTRPNITDVMVNYVNGVVQSENEQLIEQLDKWIEEAGRNKKYADQNGYLNSGFVLQGEINGLQTSNN